MIRPILEIRDLRKRYGETVALDGVSFTLEEGEIFGLLGPNGAGKTTLLSIVCGLLDATGGAVTIAGRRASSSDMAVRRMLGLVPQELAVYGDLTARENLRFIGRLYGLAGEALERRCSEVLEMIGLAEHAGRRVATYSGGMQRRLNLGMGLVHSPRLLLLDEPTTGVDPQSRNRIFDGVRQLNAAGTTIIYTSHYMEEVQALCTRVGIIDHGKLIACDTIPKLLEQLPGWIHVRLRKASEQFVERLRSLDVDGIRTPEPTVVEIECHNVKGTLVKLIALLQELDVEIDSLETREPNLERVFLHLTGRALRD